jgi:hypothetical protein
MRQNYAGDTSITKRGTSGLAFMFHKIFSTMKKTSEKSDSRQQPTRVGSIWSLVFE